MDNQSSGQLGDVAVMLLHPCSFFLPHRCVWWPWPRDPRQRKRPAGEKARQTSSKAVSWPGPGLGCRWGFHLRIAMCSKVSPSSSSAHRAGPRSCPLEAPLAISYGKKWSYLLLVVGKSLDLLKLPRSRFRSFGSAAPGSENTSVFQAPQVSLEG